jgi:hypothetical protein
MYSITFLASFQLGPGVLSDGHGGLVRGAHGALAHAGEHVALQRALTLGQQCIVALVANRGGGAMG